MASAQETVVAERMRSRAESDIDDDTREAWVDLREEARLARQRVRDALVASGELVICDDRR